MYVCAMNEVGGGTCCPNFIDRLELSVLFPPGVLRCLGQKQKWKEAGRQGWLVGW